MKYALGMLVAMSAFGSIPAISDEIELGVSLASLNERVTVGFAANDRPDRDRNMALIKEEEFASPDMVAVIESNREDRERTVVIDR
jgi:hypothetical protein